jgi:hypothetical protein
MVKVSRRRSRSDSEEIIKTAQAEEMMRSPKRILDILERRGRQ